MRGGAPSTSNNKVFEGKALPCLPKDLAATREQAQLTIRALLEGGAQLYESGVEKDSTGQYRVKIVTLEALYSVLATAGLHHVVQKTYENVDEQEKARKVQRLF